MGGAYIAFVLYAVIRIADGLLFGLLKVRPLAMLGGVRRHRPLLKRRAELGLRWLAVLLWLGYTLELLALREPFLEKTGEVLNADLSLGSLHFTLAHILTFCITVWAAFLVSRFLRFVLEEEVYQRLQLPRGLPLCDLHGTPLRDPTRRILRRRRCIRFRYDEVHHYSRSIHRRSGIRVAEYP